MTPEAGTRCPPWLPGLILLAAMAALYLGLPYASLDGDVVVFGRMGEDILRHGYLPTYVYGQNYFISLTPYAYAFWRGMLPDVLPPAFVLALAGSLFSLGGLALFLAALCRLVRRTGASPAWPAALAVLLIAGNVPFIIDQGRNSGVELSLFLAGAMVWLGARLEARHSAIDWLALGAAVGYAYISRPQMIFYGLPLAALLLVRYAWRRRAMVLPCLLPLLAGALIGLAPWLLHLAFRADHWPFPIRLSMQVGSLEEIRRSFDMTFRGILPVVFGIRPEMGIQPLRILSWGVLILPATGWALWKGRGRLPAVDYALVLGSLATLGALVLVPALSQDGEQRRYCLTIFLAGVWLCARHLPAPGYRNRIAAALALALLVASIPRWHARLEKSATLDRQLRATRERLVPELETMGAVILAPYWDATILHFLGEGRLAAESAPWGAVRTYGSISRDAFDRKTVFLAVQGREREIRARLGQPESRIPLQARFIGKTCEVWTLPADVRASALMEHFHPLYFETPYPPGSRPPGRSPSGIPIP